MSSESVSESVSWRDENVAHVLKGLLSNMVLESDSAVSCRTCRRGNREESSEDAAMVSQFRRAYWTPICIISLTSACCSW
jgi:hypothetical protein